MVNFSRKQQQSEEDLANTLRFYFYGGWCPHVTSIIKLDDLEFQSEGNYEDVKSNENVSLSFKVDDKLKFIASISCGIPEELFAHADIEWCSNGLFILRVSFTKDWDKQYDVSEALDQNKKRIITQNILYNEIKKYHHTHTHHGAEEDNLLALLFLGEGTTKEEFSIEKKEIKRSIIDHIYHQYSVEKPDEYILFAISLLGDYPTPKQLEQAIIFLYQGIGEAAFGIAFLKKYGLELFYKKLAQVNIEYIGLESAMRNIDALRGKYFFDYIKTTNLRPANKIISSISKGVTEGVIESAKGC